MSIRSTRHARIEHVCACGKVCRGNGYRSHFDRCEVRQVYEAARERGAPHDDAVAFARAHVAKAGA